MKNFYLDVHVLQTVPPSCVNRDDTGSPKTAVYGGVTRARVSSQAWKHAMREMFKDFIDEGDLGLRTKKICDLIKKYLDEGGFKGNAEEKIDTALKNINEKLKLNKGKTLDTLFFISRKQAYKLAQLILVGEKDKNAYKEALKADPAMDIALFGRMVAADPSLNFDAAAQVAHSISTHEVRNEYDYFTAVDDLAAADNAGAGHLGTTEFNSATLYRYATVNVRELNEHLGQDDTPVVTKEFVRALVCSMPTGKQNSFANRTLPDFVYITFREDQPVNLVGAFEKPIHAGKEGYVLKSIQALTSYAQEVYDAYNLRPRFGGCFAIGYDRRAYEGLYAEIMDFNSLLDYIEKVVGAYCQRN